MKIFDFEPASMAATYRDQGYLHVRHGVTDEFLQHLRDVLAAERSGEALRGAGLKGAKAQHVYQPPPEVDLSGELFRLGMQACGLAGANLALSERHFKVYDSDADPLPAAHKDRLASQVSLGVSIEVPAGSRLLLYTKDETWVNPFLTTGLRAGLGPAALPEAALDGAVPVVIADEPGDVIVFPGSALWHLRQHSAGTANLYLKMNDFGSDPLGEDPTTEQLRAGTVALLASSGPRALAGAAVRLGRCFEWAGRLLLADGGQVPFVKLWQQEAFPLGDNSYELVERLRAAGGTGVLDQGSDLSEAYCLVERGVLDLPR
ncbi:MAG: hypothetical protein ACYDH5_05370 [Acidimicrobiales bacterium]